MTVQNRHSFRIRPGMRRGLRTDAPLPTRLISNEEFPPLPQTAAQREVEDRILAAAGRLAPRLGWSRQDFLRSTGGRRRSSSASCSGVSASSVSRSASVRLSHRAIAISTRSLGGSLSNSARPDRGTPMIPGLITTVFNCRRRSRVTALLLPGANRVVVPAARLILLCVGAFLQHYGLPARLLDWSEGVAGDALPDDGGADPCLFTRSRIGSSTKVA